MAELQPNGQQPADSPQPPSPAPIAPDLAETDLNQAAFPDVRAVLATNPHSTASLTADEIEQKLAYQGFPELVRHWKQFCALKCHLWEIDEAGLDAARRKHMAPLFSHPLIGGALVLTAALFGTHQFSASILPMLNTANEAIETAFTILTTFNYAFLVTYAATFLQRHIFQSMEQIMALDVGWMLSKRNFRAWHAQTEGSRRAVAALTALEVNENWDNPEYGTYYSLRGAHCERVEARTPQEFVQMFLREFLGHKDQAQRKFIPGRFTTDLKQGKKSVTQFVNEHRLELSQSHSGTLAFESGLVILSDLLEGYVKPNSAGAKRLRERLRALAKGELTSNGIIEARIWERDPWRDLTHQEEFYSSASLRGVKPIGRGMKGRLGTFGYLRNKSISALDFSSSKGRVVRARIAAACARDVRGQTIPVLFVDGVEGSNAINPRLIQAAIEDYARDCGFKAVVYNKFVHNQIPRRFVRHLARGGAALRQLEISYMDDSTREYLDAFGLPLEPFEYAYPSGTVVGYVVELEKRILLPAKPPSLFQNLVHFAKRNALWALVGETLAYTGAIMWYSSPEFLIPYGGAAAIGIAAHWWYQLKSVRKKQ